MHHIFSLVLLVSVLAVFSPAMASDRLIKTDVSEGGRGGSRILNVAEIGGSMFKSTTVLCNPAIVGGWSMTS